MTYQLTTSGLDPVKTLMEIYIPPTPLLDWIQVQIELNMDVLIFL